MTMGKEEVDVGFDDSHGHGWRMSGRMVEEESREE
jgi:hypothetical protein